RGGMRSRQPQARAGCTRGGNGGLRSNGHAPHECVAHPRRGQANIPEMPPSETTHPARRPREAYGLPTGAYAGAKRKGARAPVSTWVLLAAAGTRAALPGEVASPWQKERAAEGPSLKNEI